MLIAECDLNNFHMRWMIKKDLPEVVAIEKGNSCRPNPVAGVWSKKDFMQVLRVANTTGIVATQRTEEGDRVVGFCVYELMPDRIHVHNLAVEKTMENKGVGTALIKRMQAKLGLKRRNFLDFDIRESNLRAQLFLRKFGFLAISVVRNWYEQPRPEDAYKFRYTVK